MKGSRRWLGLRSEMVSTEFSEVALDQGGSLDDLSAVDAEFEAVMIAAMNDRGWLMRRAWVQRRYVRSLRRGFKRRNALIARALDSLDDADD